MDIEIQEKRRPCKRQPQPEQSAPRHIMKTFQKVITFVVSLLTGKTSQNQGQVQMVEKIQPVGQVPLARQLLNDILHEPAAPAVGRKRLKKTFRAPPLPLFIAHPTNRRKIIMESTDGRRFVHTMKGSRENIFTGTMIEFRRLHHSHRAVSIPAELFLSVPRLAA